MIELAVWKIADRFTLSPQYLKIQQPLTMSSSTGKYLILGGLGSLGRHLQRTLIANGKSVVVLDRPTAIERYNRMANAENPSPQLHLEAYTLG